ncbi:hypothetical protein B0H21DRAFT_826507 [Amylocystis lapponica]|nr:hypothetical protein B0H21DRAFT_826507 [Amylocystis lapponica]
MLQMDRTANMPQDAPSRDDTLLSRPQKDDAYYFDYVTFLIEDTLFRVNRRNFQNDSQIFRDMYMLPVPDTTAVDGSSDDRPLRIDGIAKADFVQLLRVMFPSHYGAQDELTTDEWISVLKLAHMWQFDAIRTAAIRALSTSLPDPLTRIVLARDYAVAEWLVPALNALAQRAAPLAMCDIDTLGWDYALRLAAVRETFPGDTPACGCVCFACERAHRADFRRTSLRAEYDFTAQIRVAFALGTAQTPALATVPALMML